MNVKEAFILCLVLCCVSILLGFDFGKETERKKALESGIASYNPRTGAFQYDSVKSIISRHYYADGEFKENE